MIIIISNIFFIYIFDVFFITIIIIIITKYIKVYSQRNCLYIFLYILLFIIILL
jgi:hypothetical protein